jgi:hypothetical protein
MSRLQFFKIDEIVWDQQVGLPVNFGVRAYDPTAGHDGDSPRNGHSGLSDSLCGDWSWKPHRYDALGRYRVEVIGKPCTCTLHQPVGTDCARHA